MTLFLLSEAQINQFAGNMLEVQSTRGEKLIVMSQQAYDALSDDQRTTLSGNLAPWSPTTSAPSKPVEVAPLVA